MTNVHAWVRKEDETFEHLTFLDVTIAEAVERIGDQDIIAIFNEKMLSRASSHMSSRRSLTTKLFGGIGQKSIRENNL